VKAGAGGGGRAIDGHVVGRGAAAVGAARVADRRLWLAVWRCLTPGRAWAQAGGGFGGRAGEEEEVVAVPAAARLAAGGRISGRERGTCDDKKRGDRLSGRVNALGLDASVRGLEGKGGRRR